MFLMGENFKRKMYKFNYKVWTVLSFVIGQDSNSNFILDLSHAELLSVIREIYNSAIDASGNIISASKRIMKMMVGYCKKNSGPSFEVIIYFLLRFV